MCVCAGAGGSRGGEFPKLSPLLGPDFPHVCRLSGGRGTGGAGHHLAPTTLNRPVPGSAAARLGHGATARPAALRGCGGARSRVRGAGGSGCAVLGARGALLGAGSTALGARCSALGALRADLGARCAHGGARSIPSPALRAPLRAPPPPCASRAGASPAFSAPLNSSRPSIAPPRLFPLPSAGRLRGSRAPAGARRIPARPRRFVCAGGGAG